VPVHYPSHTPARSSVIVITTFSTPSLRLRSTRLAFSSCTFFQLTILRSASHNSKTGGPAQQVRLLITALGC
jgi:hypothetical protein